MLVELQQTCSYATHYGGDLVCITNHSTSCSLPSLQQSTALTHRQVLGVDVHRSGDWRAPEGRAHPLHPLGVLLLLRVGKLHSQRRRAALREAGDGLSQRLRGGGGGLSQRRRAALREASDGLSQRLRDGGGQWAAVGRITSLRSDVIYWVMLGQSQRML